MTSESGKPTTLLREHARPSLFEAFGVEIEYMIVDAGTLDVKPVCDGLMEAVTGAPDSEVERGPLAWSNELALHVLEMKTNGPAEALSGLAGRFQESVWDANRHLAAFGARLMPGGMHPWMDPDAETRLWPHEYTDVYRTFDRIFGCRGHGWANLQSTHLNLPFKGDEEFARLHAAIRLVLPLVPALAAASPFADGRRGPALDTRLVMYRGNVKRVPSVVGLVVPEPVFTRDAYERDVLGRIYDDLAGLDPDGVLCHEWVNARGAIARFERGAIEIRLTDTQECPRADLAVAAAMTEVVRALAVGPLSERDPAEDPAAAHLAVLLDRTVEQADLAPVDDSAYLRVLGLGASPSGRRPWTAGDVWRALVDRHPPADPEGEWTGALDVLLSAGPLARRALRWVDGAADLEPGGIVPRGCLFDLQEALCACLASGEPFTP